MQLFLSARNEKEKNEIVKRHFLSPFPFLSDIHRRRPGDTYLFPSIAKLQIISRRNCGTGGEKSDERERERERREIDGASNGQIYLAEEARARDA